MKYQLQSLSLPENWKISRNAFYDIDSGDEVSEDDKFINIYGQEDMLLIVNGDYYLDLGWYGSDDLDNELTGYMLVFYKGENWNNCELLELKRSKSKSEIINKINQILEAYETGFFNDKHGYEISENQKEYRYIGQHFQYSIMNNLNELIKVKTGGNTK